MAPAGPQPAGGTGLFPDLRTVVPLSLGIQNQQQREYQRASRTVLRIRARAIDACGRIPRCLVSTANYAGTYLEADYTNNTAWQAFDLTRDSSGNPKIALAGHSACETPALCGVGAPNR